MKWLEANLVVIFWAVIFGEVIGYIVGALKEVTYDPMTIGVTMAVVAVIAVNGITLLGRSDVKSAGDK
ncbi:YjzD family protein [Levilactobacillus tujiorum]|uniref:YjzD family protein n=1 Tax=Levilactobacillus tujiorum TaxID=2912243 RepID=UPI001456FD58|nr:YjzD family protein [Levilactobacillus tujiorum]